MSVEDQINRWATKRLEAMREQQRASEKLTSYVPLYGVPDSFEVVGVEFIHTDEVHYSEYTWEPAYDEARVTLEDGTSQTIGIEAEEFGDLIREILAS